MQIEVHFLLSLSLLPLRLSPYRLTSAVGLHFLKPYLSILCSPSVCVSSHAFFLSSPFSAGSFGEVYLASYGSARVAVKRLHAQCLRVEQERVVRRELMPLASLEHPNILELLAFSLMPGDVCLLTEHMPGGSLAAAVRVQTRKRSQTEEEAQAHRDLPWSRRLEMLLDVARGQPGLAVCRVAVPACVH